VFYLGVSPNLVEKLAQKIVKFERFQLPTESAPADGIVKVDDKSNILYMKR
jgi:hypothetical protein